MHLAFSVSYKFGIVAMMSGLVGVPLGSGLAQYFRRKHENSDPIICAWGLLISAPLVYVALLLARFSDGWCFFVIFLAEVSLNICWSIVADMLLVSNCLNRVCEQSYLGFERGKLTILVHRMKHITYGWPTICLAN